MRATAYVVAVLAAVGIMIGIIMLPDPNHSDPVEGGSDAVSQSETPETVMPEAGTLVLSVPTMHCQVACYPRVKQTLERLAEVETVELAEQAQADVIDNRAVVVHYAPGFDLGEAIGLLDQEGFTDVAQTQ